MTAAPATAAPRHGTQRAVLIAALLLTGLSMRTAVTSVGSVLHDVQRDLHASGVMSGLITTLPVICFAVFGGLTHRLSAVVGAHRLLTVALLVATAGVIVRPIGDSSVLFAVISVLALGGGAVSNVLMPSLVKEHFPDRIGTMTALYTTALAVGATAAAGLTVPIGDLGGGWRFGLGSWAVLCGVAVLPWLTTLRADRHHPSRPDSPTARVPLTALLRSRTAWLLAIYFGTQSLQAYIAFGWLARFLTGHGITAATAGLMVAVLSAISIPVSLVVPRLPPSRHRLTGMTLAACALAAYIGLAVAPVGGAWAWAVLYGFGNCAFPLALTLVGLRARTPGTTAALSAFVQAIGYVVAGIGPLVFGALFGATGSWGWPLVTLFVAFAVMVGAGWPSLAPRYVDDELDPTRRGEAG